MPVYSDTTELNSTRRRVELRRYKRTSRVNLVPSVILVYDSIYLLI